MTATITSPTEPQIAQVKMLVEHVVRKSGVDFDGIQRLLTQGGEFQRDILPLIHRYSRKEKNPYGDEHEEQSCYYPEGWSVPALSVQADRLASAFPDLDVTFQVPGRESMGDGFALIPKLVAIARIKGIEDPYGSGYGQVVEHVLGLIGQSRPFTNYRAGRLSADYIRINAKTRPLLEKLEAETTGDCLVIPISFGSDYAGWSVRAARWEALHHSRQLPLGSAQVGCLLLAMPDRLTHFDHLWPDCPGDEYAWDAGGYWSDFPYFFFYVGRLGFVTYYAVSAGGRFGSVVAFLGE